MGKVITISRPAETVNFLKIYVRSAFCLLLANSSGKVSNNSSKVHKRKEFDQCKSARLSCATHHDISVYDAHEMCDLLFQQYCIWLRYSWIRTRLETKGYPGHFVSSPVCVREGADKYLARPGRKQATANKLGIYSPYSPRSSINFLALTLAFTSQ